MDHAGKTHYELLGLERNATVEEIREAYREIARVFHPDSNFYDEIVEYELSEDQNGLFKVITAAYQILVHKEKREAYDRTLPPELRGWEDHRREDATMTEKFHDSQARAMKSEGATGASFGAGSFGAFGQMVENDGEVESSAKTSRGLFGSGFGSASDDATDDVAKNGGFRREAPAKGAGSTKPGEPSSKISAKPSTDGQHGLGVHHRSASVLPTVDRQPSAKGVIPSWVWTVALIAVPFLGGVLLVMLLGRK